MLEPDQETLGLCCVVDMDPSILGAIDGYRVRGFLIGFLH